MSYESFCPEVETAFILVFSIATIVMIMVTRKLAPKAGTREIQVVGSSYQVLHQMQLCIRTFCAVDTFVMCIPL